MSEWSGRWISHRLFQGVEPLNLLSKANIKLEVPEHPAHLQNFHAYYRKKFTVDSLPESVTLKITADDAYRFFINGQLVGEGPASGYVFAYPYDTYNVRDFLREGENVLAVDVYYQGLVNRVWCSGDYRQGLCLQMEIGDKLIFSDETWKLFAPKAYIGLRKTGYDTQFLEDVDGAQIPHGWKELSFDDSLWESPWAREVKDAGYELVPSGIPPLEIRKIHPMAIREVAAGHYWMDFGEEVVGTIGLKTNGSVGDILEFRYGEELNEDGSVRYKMRCNCEYLDTWKLSGDSQEEIQFFDYKSFRYLEVLNAKEGIRKGDIWILRRNTPFDFSRSSFQSSNEHLSQIWQICLNAVRCGIQGAMLDCPSREKGQYLGDAYVTSLSHLYSQGQSKVTRKMILDFAYSSRICPGLMAVAPGNFMQEIADFSLMWPMIVWEYYQFSGDRDLVRQLVPVLKGLHSYFVRYMNGDGLLENVSEKWNLVDWPENLRDGYDYKRAESGINTVLNALYQGCLQKSAELFEVAGERNDAEKLGYISKIHRKSFRELLLDPSVNLFVDAYGSTHTSLHANALALLFGLADREDVPSLVHFIRKKRLSCGVLMSMFVLRGLIRYGEQDLAYELITSDDLHSWRSMLKAGATTCMEAWAPDLKWNTSWCHPWASAPASIIPQFFMGLKSGNPGWRTLDFSPQTPAGLESAEFKLDTIQGEFRCGHRWLNPHHIHYALVIPENILMTIRVPARSREIHVVCNGKALIGSQDQLWWRAKSPVQGGKIELDYLFK